MNWKRVARACMCLLVVCCVLLNVCAIPAKATAVLPAAPVIVSVPGLNVVAAILIGMGVCAGIAMTDWNAVKNSCAEWLQDQGVLDENGNCKIIQFPSSGLNGEEYEWFAGAFIVDMVREFLYSNNILQESDKNVFEGSGFILDSTGATARSYWSGVDLYSLVSSAAPGSFLLISGNSSTLSGISQWLGLALREHSVYGIHVLERYASGGLSIPSVSYPFGQFVDCSIAASETDYFVEWSKYNSSVAQGFNMICLNYDDALKVYQSNLNPSRDRIYFLTSSSRIQPPHGVSSYQSVCSITNVGYISSSGSVVYEDLVGCYWAYHMTPGNDYTMRSFCPPFYAEKEVVTDLDLGLGVVAGPSSDLAVTYPEWYGNSNTYTDSDTGEDILVLPVPEVGTDTDFGGLSQEDVWKGELSDAIVDANTGTLAGTPIGDFWAGLTNAIVTPILQGITDIFVPSADFVSAKVDAIRSEFSFADSIISTADFFGKGLQGIETKPPVIYIDLGASTGDYNMGGKVVFMDLSWYEEYKPLSDALISAFLWAVFVWRMFMRLPGIVSGMPGDFVMDSLQGVGADRFLPFRKKEHEAVRRLNRRV